MKKVIQTRIHLDNGLDYFFSDDKDFGFTTLKGAIIQGYNLCIEYKKNVKVIACTTFENEDYKDEIIAKFDYKLIVKSEKIKI